MQRYDRRLTTIYITHGHGDHAGQSVVSAGWAAKMLVTVVACGIGRGGGSAQIENLVMGSEGGEWHGT
jgi:L-ascorbate metabolism protein UlaG (beta-lactamase superfamily)